MLPSSPPPVPSTTAGTAEVTPATRCAPPAWPEIADFEDCVIAVVVAFVWLLAAAVAAVRSYVMSVFVGPSDVFYDVNEFLPRTPWGEVEPSDGSSEAPKSDSSTATSASDGGWSDVGRATVASEDRSKSDAQSPSDSSHPDADFCVNLSPTSSSAVTFATHECVLLMTTTATVDQRANIGRARDILNKLGVPFYELNAAYGPRARVQRYKTVSGLSSVYPQVFVVKRQLPASPETESRTPTNIKQGADEDSIFFVPFYRLEEMAQRGKFELRDIVPVKPPISPFTAASFDSEL